MLSFPCPLAPCLNGVISYLKSSWLDQCGSEFAYLPAVDELKADEQLPETTELRLVLYLNNRVELSAAKYLRV